jgi:hypothetical protein
VGFITNSSSAVHWFPKELLDVPEVRAFMAAYGLSGGTTGSDLWDRSRCDSVALTEAQKHEVRTQLSSAEYSGGIGESIDPKDASTFVVIYGDEYESVTSELAALLSRICAERGLSQERSEFN